MGRLQATGERVPRLPPAGLAPAPPPAPTADGSLHPGPERVSLPGGAEGLWGVGGQGPVRLREALVSREAQREGGQCRGRARRRSGGGRRAQQPLQSATVTATTATQVQGAGWRSPRPLRTTAFSEREPAGLQLTLGHVTFPHIIRSSS